MILNTGSGGGDDAIRIEFRDDPWSVTGDGPWIVSKFDSYSVVAPSGASVQYHEPETGCLLDRRIFDQLLLRRAIDAGAAVSTRTTVCGTLRIGDSVGGVIAE